MRCLGAIVLLLATLSLGIRPALPTSAQTAGEAEAPVDRGFLERCLGQVEEIP